MSVRQRLVTIFGHKITRMLVRVYVMYIAISVALLLPILNWAASALYQQQTGRTLHYSLATFNPFTLSLTLHHAVDRNVDGTTFWAAQNIRVNPSLLQSAVRFTPTLDAVTVKNLSITVTKSSAGDWNFADILQHQARQPEPPDTEIASTELPPLNIHTIDISIDSIQFSDASREEIFTTRVDRIEFVLQDFSTITEAGQPYRLHARSGDGELAWQGDVSVKRGLSDGQLLLKNVSLKPAWQYFKNALNFQWHDGSLDFNGTYQVSWSDALTWSLTRSQVALNRFDVRSLAADKPGQLHFSALVVNGLTVSSDHMLEIDSIQLNNLGINSWSNAEQVGLIEMFTPIWSPTSVDNSASDEAPWNVKIQDVHVSGDIIWQVAELNEHKFRLSPFMLKASTIHIAGDMPAQIKFKATIDEQMSIELAGEINPATLDGQFDAQLKDLPLSLVNPLLTPYLQAEVIAGQLSVEAHVEWRNAELMSLRSAGVVEQFGLRPLSSPQELVRWEQLAWQDTHVDLHQRQIDIPFMELTGFDSRFVINTDGTTNLHKLVPETLVSPDEAAAEPWTFNLHKFALQNASFRFHDESLTPDFTAAVQRFTGELTDLSSDTKKLAAFHFKGDVDGYAPVTLEGKVQPFLDQPRLDAALNFENMDLGGFSTYSSTYAGWRIDRGLLTANLHYRLNEGRIIGDNHIVMDQLQLGERVRSASAMDIPLRLALALLTDEHGIATLEVGISGRQDDPDFNISKVIWAAVRNTLMKVVTAPFNLLASLVGSKEDLGEVKFNSGSTQLLSNATRKLTLLEEALGKRPHLRLDVRGQYDVKTDMRGLRAAHAKSILLAEGLTNDDMKKKTPAWQKAVAAQYRKLDIATGNTLTPDQQYDAWLSTFPVTDDDLRRLAVARGVIVKQFLVEHLEVSNDRVLINAEIDCTKEGSCASRTVVFDLSDTVQ